MTGTDGTTRTDQTPGDTTLQTPVVVVTPVPETTNVDATVAHDVIEATEATPWRSRRLFIGLGVAGVAIAVVAGVAVGARSVMATGRRSRHGDADGAVPGQAHGVARDPSGWQGAGRQRDVTPAVADADSDGLTPPNVEGPYFKANSPETPTLVEASAAGTRLILTGKVTRRNGTPVAKALLDFWQANPAGQYDNRGYNLRGHQFTAADGTYRLETVVPGLYPGRTRHIHVKVQAPSEPTLTTQLYFPEEVKNSFDGIYDPRLVMKQVSAPTSGPVQATFNFVIAG